MSTGKQVYIFYNYFNPAYKAGGPIQSIANLVNQLYQNISYKIVCSDKDLDEKVLQVKNDCWTVYNEHTKVWYSSKKSILSLIKEINIDIENILFINGIYSWRFNLIPLLFCKATKKIVSARGMLHPGALSQKSLKKKIYIVFWKALNLHNKCAFHASTQNEKLYIQNIFGKNVKICIAQNFPRIFNFQLSPSKIRGSLSLVSIALISPMKNHLLVIKSLMHYSGNILFNIYGPVKDHAYWRICLEEIKKLPPNIVVNYQGNIQPDKVGNALANNHVFILPSKSENFGHAIFEALSAGRPVITSDSTPWNDLQLAKAGININPDTQNELISAINFFVQMDQIEFEHWNKGANKYATNAINIDEIKEQYRKMFFA